jgi:hydroxyacylglutathione hydrolase
MKIKTMVLGELGTNTYIISSQKSDSAVVIDPADDASAISEYLLINQLAPKAILATHGHFDHILAAEELSLNFQIPIYMNEKDAFLAKRANETAKHFLGTSDNFNPSKILPVKEGDKLDFGDILFSVINIPGHTPGSVAYVINNMAVFSGDLVFEEGRVGDYHHAYSSYSDLKKSISKLSKLEGGLIIYPGHGNPIAITDLQRKNL